ncbi:MAG TPA: HD domain-containing protein [Candidatus Paceibacterota bacterium]
MKARPPPYEIFFNPLAATGPSERELIGFAYVCSKYGHGKQKRDDGRRYFDHPKGAAWIYIHELGGRDARIICVTLLHDVPEDTYLLSPYRLALNFGEDIALDTLALKKLPKDKETVEQYLGRIIDRGPRAILAKLLDCLDNLRDLAGCTPEKRAKTIEEKQKYHLRILVPALRKCGANYAPLATEIEKLLKSAIADARGLA